MSTNEFPRIDDLSVSSPILGPVGVSTTACKATLFYLSGWCYRKLEVTAFGISDDGTFGVIPRRGQKVREARFSRGPVLVEGWGHSDPEPHFYTQSKYGTKCRFALGDRAMDAEFDRWFAEMSFQIMHDFRTTDFGESKSNPVRPPADELVEPSLATSMKTRRLKEGTPIELNLTRFERNQQARCQCIEHWGTACVVCNLDFGARYGDAASGFIHVHHLIRLADIGTQYEIDPVNDLRPVCPNCHSVIHLREPPYGIEDVRSMLLRPE